MAVSDCLQLDSFEVHLDDINEVPVGDLQALSMGVRWPHRADDWRTYLSLGEGVVARDSIGRVLGSAMWFPMGPTFATFGMVITTPRMQTQGAGARMVDMGVTALGKRDLALNATRQAKRLYLALGFVPERMVYQHQGKALPPPEVPLTWGETLRDITWDDMEPLCALDARAYGVERRHVLRYLMGVAEGVVLEREGEIVAYAFVRRFGRGHVIGPIIAARDHDAMAVTAPHLLTLEGRFARIDTREEEGAFARFLVESGLGVFDTVTTMSRGRPWSIPRPPGDAGEGPVRVYGLVNQGLG